MKVTNKLKWERPYVGPFTKSEAEAIVADFKKIAEPEKNLIYDARIIKRNGRDYDIEIQTEYESN